MTCWHAALGVALAIAGLAGTAHADSNESPIIVRGAPLQRAPEVFGTVGLPVRADRYAELWAHASSGDLQAPILQRFIAPARHLDRAGQLAFVQRAVRSIGWRSDATVWGQHEYWATAAETLRAGYADDDCLAVLKLQALEALGWSPRDLFLTLGHDVAAGPIAVLIVRDGDRWQILDERSDHPVVASQRTGFTPQLSFGSGGAWLHGVRYAGAGRTAAAR